MPRKKEQPVPAEETVRLISASKLKSLLSSAQKASEDCAEINGSLGEEIKTAIEKHHLDRWAFNTTRRLMRMSPERLRESLDHFNYYLDASGLAKKAESAPRLPMGDSFGEDDDNVHHLQSAE